MTSPDTLKSRELPSTEDAEKVARSVIRSLNEQTNDEIFPENFSFAFLEVQESGDGDLKVSFVNIHFTKSEDDKIYRIAAQDSPDDAMTSQDDSGRRERLIKAFEDNGNNLPYTFGISDVLSEFFIKISPEEFEKRLKLQDESSADPSIVKVVQAVRSS